MTNEYKIMSRDSEGVVQTVSHVWAQDMQHAIDMASFEQLHSCPVVELWRGNGMVAMSVNGTWLLNLKGFGK